MASRGKKKVVAESKSNIIEQTKKIQPSINSRYLKAYPFVLSVVICMLLVAMFTPFIQITVDIELDGTKLSESLSERDRTFGISLFEVMFTPASDSEDAVDYIVSKLTLAGESLPSGDITSTLKSSYLTQTQINQINSGYNILLILSYFVGIATLSVLVVLFVRIYNSKINLKLALTILSIIIAILSLICFIVDVVAISFGNANMVISIGVGIILYLISGLCFAAFTSASYYVSRRGIEGDIDG